MPRTAAPRFRKHLIALAASAALAPHGAWALDLATAPPGSVEPYVRPNVIISIDDSGSMDFCLNKESTADCVGSTDAQNNRTPNADGTWPLTSRRINVLKYALIGYNGVGGVIRDTGLLPDKKIRMAWQAMHNNAGASGASNVNSTSMNTNSMRVLDSTHRNNFISFINGLDANNGTPAHEMFSQADAYMRQPLGRNSPWASEPGVTGAPYLGCRRSYHILMTDGRWNGTAIAVPDTTKRDNATNLTLPDGMVYGGATTADQAKSALYRDNRNGTTLADWAFYSWAVPPSFASSMTGTMQPAADYRKAPATENFGTTTSPAILDRYWNPRYNPATWPHMVTYTIGFSAMATTWPGASTIISPTNQVPFGYDGSFPDFVRGTQTWPLMDAENKRSLDLWHAALNGRGRFYAVEDGADLEKAFRDIFGQINTATDPDLSASATSGSNVSRSEVGKYTASYEPLKAWKGSISADRVTSNGTTTPDPGWAGKNTADKLDALSSIGSRLILSWSDKWETSQYKGGVPFQWASDETKLSAAQKVWLQKNTGGTTETTTKGEQRLNYIRGDRSLEGVDPDGYTTSKPYRQRYSRQGDIINSDVWYTGAPAADYLLKGYTAFVRNHSTRPGMLYVGGNDGMLHGFAANNGEEKIAYVPRGVIPSLTYLTDPTYNESHKYFVDGSPMTGDVDMNGGLQDPDDPGYGTYTPDWRTLLVGTLGLGGKGYFVLDVTNPTANTVQGIAGFSEANASQLVKLDRTRGSQEPAPNCAAMSAGLEKTTCEQVVTEDKDIGHITAKPVLHDNDNMRSSQITRMNNNRWAVVLGNGYNSTNQRPVLLIQYLDGNKELVRIPTTTEPAGTGNANDNGLAAPRVVDLNGDNRADIVYAGDNLGNLWKFDLTSSNASSWKVAFGGNPLFTARGPAALGSTTRTKIQAISGPPTVRANDRTMTTGSGSTAKTVRVGGMMVAFGTGRNITRTDPESIDVQSLYSVLDNTRYKEVGAGESKRLEIHPGGSGGIPAPAALGTGVTTAKLAQQTFEEVGGGDYGAIKPVSSSQELKKETWASFNGWYVDLPAVGERVLKPMGFYDASNVLTVWSQVPAKGSDVDPNIESCESSSVDEERQFRTFVNIMDGKAPTVQVVDKDKNGKFDMANGDGILVNGKYIGISRAKVTKGPHAIISTSRHQSVDIDAKNNQEKLARMPEESLRPSWRQIQ